MIQSLVHVTFLWRRFKCILSIDIHQQACKARTSPGDVLPTPEEIVESRKFDLIEKDSPFGPNLIEAQAITASRRCFPNGDEAAGFWDAGFVQQKNLA
jgi:hypothetical protein